MYSKISFCLIKKKKKMFMLPYNTSTFASHIDIGHLQRAPLREKVNTLLLFLENATFIEVSEYPLLLFHYLFRDGNLYIPLLVSRSCFNPTLRKHFTSKLHIYRYTSIQNIKIYKAFQSNWAAINLQRDYIIWLKINSNDVTLKL